MNAIVQNKHLFKDKVVLDVGCGTAILSMYVNHCPVLRSTNVFQRLMRILLYTSYANVGQFWAVGSRSRLARSM